MYKKILATIILSMNIIFPLKNSVFATNNVQKKQIENKITKTVSEYLLHFHVISDKGLTWADSNTIGYAKREPFRPQLSEKNYLQASYLVLSRRINPKVSDLKDLKIAVNNIKK